MSEIAREFYGDRIIMTPLAIGDWDWGSDDWDESQADTIKQKAAKIIEAWKGETAPGTILAFHDSAQYNLPNNKTKNNWPHRAWPTLEAVPEIIDLLEAKGMKIKKLSEMKLIEERQDP